MTRAARTRIKVVTIAYALALAAASLLPGGSRAPGEWDLRITPVVQNTFHVPAYGVLGILAIACMPGASRPGKAATLAAALACAGYGALLELAQCIVPGRIGSFSDTLLNAAGVCLGVLAATLWQVWRPRAGASPNGPLDRKIV